MKRFCDNFALISSPESGFGSAVVKYAYQQVIRKSVKNDLMLSQLNEVEGIENVSLTMQEQLLEA